MARRKEDEASLTGAVQERAPIAQGVGESRIFAAPGTFPVRSLKGCTVNGEPLPEEFWETFPYSLTDQGKAEARAEMHNLPLQYTGRDRTDYSQISNDDKKLDKYRDDLESDEFSIASDPFKVPMERHTPKGHRGLFVSERQVKDKGFIRNGLDYKPVLVKNPETGTMERVVVGGMFLASVPEEDWRRSENYYAGLTRSRMVEADGKVREQADQIMSEQGIRDVNRRKRIADRFLGREEDNPEQADMSLLNDDVDRREEPAGGVFHE